MRLAQLDTLLLSVDFFRILGEAATSALLLRAEEKTLSPDEVLLREGEPGEAMFLLTEGSLRVHTVGRDGRVQELARLQPGSLVGEMQVVFGGNRAATVTALERCRLLVFPRPTVNEVLSQHPASLEELTALAGRRLRRGQFIKVLRTLVGDLDPRILAEFEEAAEWVSLKRGDVLFRQGDPPDAWYVVASGKLQAIHTSPRGEDKVVGEIGSGEGVGEMALVTREPRTATIQALRDSDLLRVPSDRFDQILLRHSSLLMAVTRTLIARLKARLEPKRSGALTVALVPAHDGVPLADVATRLTAAFSRLGPALHLSASRLRSLGVLQDVSALSEDHPNWLRFAAWLDEQTEQHAFIVFESDVDPTPWSFRGSRAADRVLIVGDASFDPQPGRTEAAVCPPSEDDSRRARRVLLLLQSPDTKLPTGTLAWLEARRVESHHHLRGLADAEFDRLARLLSGRAVGVVLGGGGARGFAHVGVVKALRESGIPVDCLGGTSMGAIMACQLAMGLSTDDILNLNARIAATKPFSEYTVPMVALLRSKKVAAAAEMAFGDTQMEDLWVNCFAVASNLTTATMEVFDRGSAVLATRASGALPGIVVPVIRGEHLLVDGGVINNLPGDVMKSRMGGKVIAINVSPEEDLPVPPEGIPSQWSIFWRRMLPFMKQSQAPSMGDILMRTIMLGSASRTHAVEQQVDLVLRPPIQRYGMLQFESMAEIVETGYRHTMERLEAGAWPVLA